MAYESLGPWDRMMEDKYGCRYRVWKYTDRSTGETIHEKFPSNWEDYFARPSIFPQTPLGKFLKWCTTYNWIWNDLDYLSRDFTLLIQITGIAWVIYGHVGPFELPL